MKFEPEDFEAAFGITKLDHTDIPDLNWQQICKRAADTANDKYTKAWHPFGVVLEDILKEIKQSVFTQ